jgi:tetratricopeptide (TPR) repeat protein
VYISLHFGYAATVRFPFHYVLLLAICTPSIALATGAEHDMAQAHFLKAKELYNGGDYAAAKTELEKAHELDPTAKELLYNLSIISEKMQDYDAAMGYLHKVAALPDTPPEERETIETSIGRLDGAKKSQKKSEPTVIVKTVTVKEPARTEPSPGLTLPVIVTGSLTLAALGVGITTGILALSTKPNAGAITSSAYPYSSWRADQDRAQSFALISDVSVAAFAGGAIVTGILYWLSHPSPTKTAESSK